MNYRDATNLKSEVFPLPKYCDKQIHKSNLILLIWTKPPKTLQKFTNYAHCLQIQASNINALIKIKLIDLGASRLIYKFSNILTLIYKMAFLRK